ncbi:hypothetical protein [Hydrogenophaga sp.]|uniref:hypothetical protein n=1 Tax=Hydrogenophaga sp. TaxID=1904254 RepID=UPI002603F80D|nr:hypothetical protein [Hydrogenophaga sp.]MDM7948570.1 hypothetical protein [Hydrogenophaga sp.]
MNKNAATQPTGPAAGPVEQPVKVKPKTTASSPVKKAPRAAVKAPKRIVVKQRGIRTADESGIAEPVKRTSVKAIAPKPKAGKTTQRPQKAKMVRDSFTFPEAEHKRLVEMKKRLIALGTDVKKGELVRAGLELLAALDNQKLLKAVATVEKLKTGRPKK